MKLEPALQGGRTAPLWFAPLLPLCTDTITTGRKIMIIIKTIKKESAEHAGRVRGAPRGQGPAGVWMPRPVCRPCSKQPWAQHHGHQHQTAAAPASATSTPEPITLLLLTSAHLRWGTKPPLSPPLAPAAPHHPQARQCIRFPAEQPPCSKALAERKKGAGKHFRRRARKSAVGQDAPPGM